MSKILLTNDFDFTRMLTIAVHFKMNMNIVCRKSRIKTRLTQNGIDQEKRYNMLSTGIFFFFCPFLRVLKRLSVIYKCGVFSSSGGGWCMLRKVWKKTAKKVKNYASSVLLKTVSLVFEKNGKIIIMVLKYIIENKTKKNKKLK